MGTREQEIEQLERDCDDDAISVFNKIEELENQIDKLQNNLDQAFMAINKQIQGLTRRVLLHEATTGFNINEAIVKHPEFEVGGE